MIFSCFSRTPLPQSRSPVPAVLFPLLMLAASAQAADTGLAGDWGGLRSASEAHGVELGLSYTNEAMGNLSGGSRHAFAQSGQLSASARIDLERVWGWPGARVDAALSKRDGDDLNSRAGINALLGPHEIHGRGNVLRLAELSLRQQLFDDRVTLKLGRSPVGGDFGHAQCDFLSLAYCGSLVGNITDDWYNWPISQWSAIVNVALDGTHYVKAGVYQVNSEYLDTRRALALSPSGTTGALSVLEAGWTPQLRGLPGSYKLGGWYDSSVREDVLPLDPVDAAVNPARRGSHGGYLALSQQFTSGDGASADSGLRGSLSAAVTDRRSNAIAHSVAAGLVYTGIGAARARDAVGMAASTSRYNPRATRTQRLQSGLGPADVQHGSEYAVELFYSIAVMPGLELRPDLQWIGNPGARERDDVVIIGLRTSLVF